MQHTIEDVSPVKKKISVTVSADEVDAAIKASAQTISRQVNIKGFRKGKAPLGAVKARYKADIMNEVRSDLLNQHLAKVIGDAKIKPVDQGDLDAGEVVEGAEFAFTFTCEVMPAFDLPEYKGVAVDVEKVELSDEQFETVLEQVKKNFAQPKEIEEARTPEDGDIVTLSFVAEAGDGFEEFKADNFQLTMGEGQALPEFEAIVKGLKPGESGSGDVNFPEGYHMEEVAGKTVTMNVTLHSISVLDVPELDDEFAKKMGASDKETLVNAVRESWTKNQTDMARQNAQKRIMDALIEVVEIDVPDSMVDRASDQLIGEMSERLQRAGQSLESLGKSEEELRADNREEAVMMATGRVILQRIAEAEELTVEPQEVEQELYKAAMQSGQDPQQMRDYYMQTGLISVMNDRMLEAKTLEWILDNAEQNEVAGVDLPAPDGEGTGEGDSGSDDEPKKKAPAKKKDAPKKKAPAKKKAAPKKDSAEDSAKDSDDAE